MNPVVGGSPATTGGADSGSGGSGGAAAMGPSCERASSAWESCTNWEYQVFGKYVLRNNIWGQANPDAGEQCIWANSERCWGIGATHKDGNGWVKGYPQAIRGWVVGNGDLISGHGLGLPVASLKKAKIHWSMDAPSSGRFMGLWDIYFHETATPGGEKGSTVLMIFQRQYDDTGWLMDDSASHEVIQIDGRSFRYLRRDGGDNAAQTIVLWPEPFAKNDNGIESATFDLKAIIDDMRQRGAIRDAEFLTSIQIGWEIIEGGTFQTQNFWTAVQDEPDGG